MPNRGIFKQVSGLRPGRSAFDLSYEKKMTAKFGRLYPIMCDEAIPGDTFSIGNQIIVRFQPLVAPILHEINVYTHYYFVPYRLLFDGWEKFYGTASDDETVPVLPRWEPTNTDESSLWDYMGFPIGITPAGAYPLDFPRLAYNKIFNEYYRDEDLQTEIALSSEIVQYSAWEKDYYTSSRPFQQKGTAPALPISGSTSAVWDEGAWVNSNIPLQATVPGAGVETIDGIMVNASTAINLKSTTPANVGQDVPVSAAMTSGAIASLNANTVDLSVASTFDIAQLRTAFQIQKWLERNARAGTRYTELLTSHWGVSPRDDRLDRAEYIGGTKSPVIISEVLQTNASASDVQVMDTPQGNLAGHAITADAGLAAKYTVSEPGLIMGIMKVMPRTAYEQGINRQWLRESVYDFPWPEFVNLSEQAVVQAELRATAVEAENQALFGYQGRYDELRTKDNMVCGGMRSNAATTFNYWHMGRYFETAPQLNESFIKADDVTDRIFAVQDGSDYLIVNIANKIRAVRPIPVAANPGLIDHH